MRSLRRAFSNASCFQKDDNNQERGIVYMGASARSKNVDKKQPAVNRVEMNHFGESTNPLPPSTLDNMTDRVRESFGAMGTLLSAQRAPLPTGTGDGTALPVEQDDSVASTLATIVKDVSHLGFDTVEKVAKMTLKTKSGSYINDKEYLMEHLINVSFPIFLTCRQRLKHPLGRSAITQRQSWSDFNPRLCNNTLGRFGTSAKGLHE
jgi:hypothetical protein